APQKPKKPIALLGEPAQPLPRAARVFTGNHADVTREGFAVTKSGRIPHEYFGRERREWPHARMRHEAARLWPGLRVRANALIELLDVPHQFGMEHLQCGPSI